MPVITTQSYKTSTPVILPQTETSLTTTWIGWDVSLADNNNVLSVYRTSYLTDIYDWNGSGWVYRETLPGSGKSTELTPDANTMVRGYQVGNSATVYDRIGGVWTQRGASIPGASGDVLGWSSSITNDGNRIVVSADSYDGGAGADQGRVRIYDWNGSSWVNALNIEAADAAANDQFGYGCSLSGDGNVLAVGSVNAEQVYIYDWNGSAYVERLPRVTPDTPQANERFGYSVSLNSTGTVLATGSTYWDGNGFTDVGRVLIFDWNGSSWVQRTEILSPIDANGARFGFSINISTANNLVAVGATSTLGAGGIFFYQI